MKILSFCGVLELELLNNDESLDSGFIACHADCFDLEEGHGEPSPAES